MKIKPEDLHVAVKMLELKPASARARELLEHCPPYAG
jgi:hypothetical protein